MIAHNSPRWLLTGQNVSYSKRRLTFPQDCFVICGFRAASFFVTFDIRVCSRYLRTGIQSGFRHAGPIVVPSYRKKLGELRSINACKASAVQTAFVP